MICRNKSCYRPTNESLFARPAHGDVAAACLNQRLARPEPLQGPLVAINAALIPQGAAPFSIDDGTGLNGRGQRCAACVEEGDHG